MATRVGLVKFWMTFFDWPTPKTPSFVQNSGTYLKCELSYCDFCMKICKFFVTLATGIGLIQISLAQLNRPAPKTLYLVQESWWYLLYKLSNGRFSDEIANFGVQQKLGWLSLIGLLQKNPSSVQKSGTNLKCKLSYSEFCVNISKFLLPWQQGLSDTNFTYTVKLADCENPLFGAKNLGDISYTSWVMDDFLLKFANFCCHANKGGSNKNLDDSVWMAYPQNPKPPVRCKNLGLILNASWVVVNFVWKFPNFVTMATGIVWHKFHLHS